MVARGLDIFTDSQDANAAATARTTVPEPRLALVFRQTKRAGHLARMILILKFRFAGNVPRDNGLRFDFAHDGHLKAIALETERGRVRTRLPSLPLRTIHWPLLARPTIFPT